MKIYFIAAWERRDEMREYAELLRLALPGATVVSRWVFEDGPDNFEAASDGRREVGWGILGSVVSDLHRADTVICFTEGPDGPSRGTRHVEVGFVLGWNVKGDHRQVVLVGPFENPGHCDMDIEVYDSFRAWMTHAAEACQ